jgi:hypothetical protein
MISHFCSHRDADAVLMLGWADARLCLSPSSSLFRLLSSFASAAVAREEKGLRPEKRRRKPSSTF